MSEKRTPSQWIYLYLTGFAMGAADVVPGVSGGTMAFIMGIYRELIKNVADLGANAVKFLTSFQLKSFFKSIPWAFFIVLGLGVLSAILSLASLISYLLDTHPAYIFSFFGGLILASAIAVFGVVKFARVDWLVLIFATVLTAWIVGLNPMQNVSHSLPFLFVSGMIAISAMILPGISGSFILLLLGQYEFILEAVRDRNLLVVITVAMGCGIGLLLAVHVVNFFLTRFYKPTIASLVGIMLGSLRLISMKVIEGFAMIAIDFMQALGIVAGLFIVGFVVVSVLDHLQSKSNPVFTFFSSSQT